MSTTRPAAAPILAFFGHDAHDAAVRRRIRGLAGAGAQVTGYTMRRGPPAGAAWPNVDLGPTRDAAYVQRLAALGRALALLAGHRAALRQADVFYARNLDMLMLAAATKALSGARARLVYECLDVHRFMTRSDAIGAAARAVERALLVRCALLVVSSPAFLREYFEPRYPGRYRAMVIENRLAAAFDYGPRPALEARRPTIPVVIGWFGNLRCRRSLDLLLALARAHPRTVRVVLRGIPALTEFPDFHARLKREPNISYDGPYAWPGDLAGLYGGVDLVWAGDFHDAGANSRWLLPNRLYEGGYYAVPPIAPAASETGRWIAARGLGFSLPEPLEETLPALLGRLNAQMLRAARASLLNAPVETFLQPPTEMDALLAAALGRQDPAALPAAEPRSLDHV